MRSELEKRAGDAVAMAKTAGAKDAFASASRSREVSFTVRDGKLEEVTDSTSRSLSIELYVNGRYSSHTTTDLRPKKLQTFVDGAVTLTRRLQSDPFRQIPEAGLYAGRLHEATLELVDPALKRMTREQRLDLCSAMNSRLAGKPGVASASSQAGDSQSLLAMASSNGFAGSYEATSVGIFSEVSLKEGDKRPEDWMAASARHLDKLPPPDWVADEALRLARARLGTRKGPTRRCPMVVNHRAAGRLVGRLLAPASGASVQQGRSFWKGKQGTQQVANILSVTDQPLLAAGLGSRPFDGEGIAARSLPVIDKGVFANLYLDTYYARKLKREPTTGSPSNRVIALGSRGRSEILKDVGDGLYVTSWLGGNMDSTTGDFSFGVRGHVIEHGQIGAPVGEMNITGNIITLFGRLREVGNDPWIYSTTLVPTLVFDDVQFSGT